MGLFSSLFGSGRKSAWDTRGLEAAVSNSNQLYKDATDQTLATGKTWLDLGQAGAEALGARLDGLTQPFGVEQFQADPSYGFLQSEAQKAIERSAAARGSVLAPSTLKALQERSQSLASTEYNNAFNRNMAQNASIYDMLMGVSGVGQDQAMQDGQMRLNYADAVSNNNIGLNNAILANRQARNASTQSMLGNWISAGSRLATMGMGGR